MAPRIRPSFATVAFAALAMIASATGAHALAGQTQTPASAVQPGSIVSLAVTPLEARLLDDAADGCWNDYSLLAAAIIASGVDRESDVRTAIEKFRSLAITIRTESSRSGDAEERAAIVLSCLHRRLLEGGYDLQATELPSVFSSGRYNCVSATVLYNSLATEAGLVVGAVRLPNHTCSMLVDGDRRIRVEATCADWFEARHRPPSASLDDHADSAASAFVEASAESAPALSEVALVGMIYYNRGVEAVRRRELERAIRLNRFALRLDPANQAACGNLLAAINKRALELCGNQEFQQAIALLDNGLKTEPKHPPLHANRAFVYHRWLEAINSSDDQRQANQVLANAILAEPTNRAWAVWRARLSARDQNAGRADGYPLP